MSATASDVDVVFPVAAAAAAGVCPAKSGAGVAETLTVRPASSTVMLRVLPSRKDCVLVLVKRPLDSLDVAVAGCATTGGIGAGVKYPGQ